MVKEENPTGMVRAVKVLDSELKAQAKKLGYKETDIVLVKRGRYGSEPPYEIVAKIDGSIVEFQKKNGVVVKG